MRVSYGLVGTTRGHAVRALAIGQELIERGHEVLFFTDGDAEELLKARFGEERVCATETPKYYFTKGKISIRKTLSKNLKFLIRRKKLAQPIIERLKSWKPDVTIADYDPFMWQVSKVLKIPHVALNSQEFLNSSPLPKGIKLSDRIQAKFGGKLLRRLSPTADLRVVGKIMFEKHPWSKAEFVGAIIRQEFDKYTWTPQGTHCLVYSSIIPDKTLAEINKLAKRENRRAMVFGIAQEKVEQHDWLDYQPTSETGFIEAMCNADFVISGAGNQLLAETLHLGIPVLITPIPNQFEQTITAKMQVIAKPDQFVMFHADAEIPTPDKDVDKSLTAGRSRAVDLIEQLVNRK